MPWGRTRAQAHAHKKIRSDHDKAKGQIKKQNKKMVWKAMHIISKMIKILSYREI